MGGTDRQDSIDWPAVQQRLAAAEEQLARAFAGQGPWAEQLLRQRRDMLARRPARAEAAEPAEGPPLLRVRGRTLDYALPAAGLREIAPVERIAAVPGGPPALIGLISLRGHVLRLFDLDALVGSPAPAVAGGLAIRLRRGEAALWVAEAVAVTAAGPVRPAGPEETFRLVHGVVGENCFLLDLAALEAAIDSASDGRGEPP